MEHSTDPLAQRRLKLQQLKERGHAPYPHRYDYTHTLSQVRERYDGSTADELVAEKTELRVCGRILNFRPHGKAGFLDLSDGQSRLQVYVKRDVVGADNFELYQLFDLGDIVAAEGGLFRTRTNELTVAASRVHHLAKSLMPLPEKWHGLTDIETRVRQRYVDLIANPDARDIFVRRSRIIREVRSFLDAHDYIEVETPVLQGIAGGALARPFATHHNALDMDLYLRIALELHLKRLIVGGMPRVYELGRIFRNEGISSHHNPEFTMLEFYQAYSDFRDLMDLTQVMLTTVAEKVTGALEVPYREHMVNFREWHRYTMKESIVKFWPAGSPPPSEAELGAGDTVARLLEGLGISFAAGEKPGKLLGTLFESVVEPHLIQPTFIYDYPTELSPLSKRKPDDPSTVERFELYIAGMEVANAYSELNDPLEQYERFEEQLQARGRGDQEAHAMDLDYIRALCYGMPPTAGEGIGIDRLTMILTNSRSIRDVILFPLLRHEADTGFDQVRAILAGAKEPGARSQEPGE